MGMITPKLYWVVSRNKNDLDSLKKKKRELLKLSNFLVKRLNQKVKF